jgi:hypothetical protein
MALLWNPNYVWCSMQDHILVGRLRRPPTHFGKFTGILSADEASMQDHSRRELSPRHTIQGVL